MRITKVWGLSFAFTASVALPTSLARVSKADVATVERAYPAVERLRRVEGLVGSSVEPLAVTLVWSDTSDGERGFRVERSSDGKIYTHVSDVPSGATQVRVEGLEEGRAYRFRVAPLGAHTVGNTATLDVYTPLRGPTDVTARKTAPWQVTLEWEPSESPLVRGFDIYWAVNQEEFRFFDEVDADLTGYRFASAVTGDFGFAVVARGEFASSERELRAFPGRPQSAESALSVAIDTSTGRPFLEAIESAAGSRTWTVPTVADQETPGQANVRGTIYTWDPPPPAGEGFPATYRPGEVRTLTVENLPPYTLIEFDEVFQMDGPPAPRPARGRIRIGDQSAEGVGKVKLIYRRAENDGSSLRVKFESLEK